MTRSVSFRLDYPPTVNLYWRSRVVASAKGHFVSTYLTPRGRRYRESALGLNNGDRFDGPVAVSLDVVLPDRRKRDLDNIVKAVLDAIGHAGIYADDSQVCQLIVTRRHVEPPGCVDVTIAEVE